MVLGLGSKHKSTRSSGGAFMTFNATSGQHGTITAHDSNRQQVANIYIQNTGRKDFTLSRTAPGDSAGKPIAQVSSSSLSGKTQMSIHGQQMNMSQSWEGMRSGKDIEAPTGRLEWRTGGSTFHNVEELTEKRTGQVVAKCKISAVGRGESWMEILSPRDEVFIDMVVASWVVMMGD